MHARTLLVEHGRDAVTLRAIARGLGITAPALYRYYDSREDLLRHVCDDICADLAAELQRDLDAVAPDGGPGQVFVVCRGFRRWALAHPQEFTLVFASPDSSGWHQKDPGQDYFGRVFLTVAGRVLASQRLASPGEQAVPEGIRSDLATFREIVLITLGEQGIELSTEQLDLGTVYLMVQFWARLYGHVALEVFGCFPVPIANPEPMFEDMLAGLAVEAGLLPSATALR